MKQGNRSRSKVQNLKRSRDVALANGGNGRDQADMEMKALEALNAAYRRISRVLADEIDRSKKDIDRMSDLGGRLRWVAERQKLVRTALQGGPDYAAYLCSDCVQLQEVRSLAETAAKLAHDSQAYPTTLNLLNYIDHELGWTPLAKSA
ncbi:hypothetical protein [Dongia sp.]|uniref:hypothetical protein n=1 Tax=Dongia sp. TaxID=1977262 RepID=UPI0035B2AEE5